MVAARGVQAIAIIGTFEVLAVIAFSLRMYTRFILTGNNGKEDYCLIFAVECFLSDHAIWILTNLSSSAR